MLILSVLTAAKPASAAQRLTLVWDPSPDNIVTGYMLYCADVDAPHTERIDVANTNVCILTNLTEGHTYQFYVTAYVINTGLESDPSNILELTMPPSIVTTWPTASPITWGHSLAESTLSGGAASVNGSFAFSTPGTLPCAGTTAQAVTFTPDDTTNLNPVNGTVNVTVAKATATVTLGNLNQTYDGSAKPAIATTDPSGLAVDLTYDGSPSAPTAAGSYTVVGTVDDPNCHGLTSGILEIARASSVTTIQFSPNAPDGGSNFTFTATVEPASPTLTGSVLFLTNGVATGEPMPLSNNTATIEVASLPPGTNIITARYLGDANHSGSSESVLRVIPATAWHPTAIHIAKADGGAMTVTFAGTPGAEYLVLSTTNLAEPWEVVSTNVASAAGQWIYTDSSPAISPQRFYRAIKP